MRELKPLIIDQADVDWENWDDPANADPSAIQWKLLISRERDPSGGLVSGVARIAPGAARPSPRLPGSSSRCAHPRTA